MEQKVRNNKFVYRQNNEIKMNVHSRKFASYLKDDEQLVNDDRNNNLKSGQLTEKQEKLQWNQMDEMRLKFQNSEQNMEKHLSDTHSNDSHSSRPVETIKTNTVINFSVESILNGSNCTKKSDTESIEPNTFEKVISPQKSTVPEECSRIYRPMPMRYMSNSTFYHGKRITTSF